jgi:hypothetical protein
MVKFASRYIILIMAQFDFLIIFPLLCSLFFMLSVYHFIFIKVKIPNYFEVKKFRKKIVGLVSFYSFLNHNKKVLATKVSYKQTIFF